MAKPKKASSQKRSAIADRKRGTTDRSDSIPREDAPPIQGAAPPGDSTFATVNGRPLDAAIFWRALVATHGVALLTDLAVLESAKKAAADRGIVVSPEDITREKNRALQKIGGEWNDGEGETDLVRANEALKSLLRERNASVLEFEIGLERNAYLRKLIDAELRVSDSDIQQEYAAAFDRKAVVRHIQLASLAEATRVREELSSGKDFGDVALHRSANRGSASHGGLLEPFTANDSAIPAAIRDAAFTLEQGRISPAVRSGPWIHLLRLERIIPAETPPLDEVRPKLERRIRDRWIDQRMPEFREKLIHDMQVIVQDPRLDAAWRSRDGAP